MEGPFLNPEKAGANNPEFTSVPDVKKFKKFVHESCVRIMTVSPEIGDFTEIFEAAKEENVVLSVGQDGCQSIAYNPSLHGHRQVVRPQLPKLVFAGSNPVARSIDCLTGR